MNDQILLLVCVSLFVPFASLPAQSDNQQKFAVSGTVLNSVTNEPVGGALVDVATSQGKGVMTGPDGHFQIDGVSAGPNNITARRPGFDQPDNQQAINVDSGTDSITVKLTPLSRISGRVSDSEGEPIEGAAVRCIAQQIVNGHKQWLPLAGANTDEAGNFLLEDLKAGSYILTTQEKQLYFTQPKSEAARYVYPPTFYPDSPSRDMAQRIDLAAGRETRADITLHAIRGVRVSVATVPAIPDVIASITQDDEQFGSNQTQAAQSGRLTFAAIPPGRWKVIARAPFGPRQQQTLMDTIYGEAEVEVASTDIDNLKLPMAKLADIPVIVSGAGSTAVYVQLYSKQGMTVNGSNQEPGGELKIHSVTPGTYRVAIPANGSDNCITSVMSGTQDLLRDDLVVSAGASPASIQITESSHCAELTINTSGTGVAIITSSNLAFEPRVVPIGPRYVSDFKAFAEGDYKVYAFDDISNLEYTNPDTMRDFKNQQVHLEAGQKSTVQLEINERRSK